MVYEMLQAAAESFYEIADPHSHAPDGYISQVRYNWLFAVHEAGVRPIAIAWSNYS